MTASIKNRLRLYQILFSIFLTGCGLIRGSLSSQSGDGLKCCLYVSDAGDATISVFKRNTTTGALTPISGSPFPSGATLGYTVLSHPNGKFLYVLDMGVGKILGYSISSSGTLTPLIGSPFGSAISGNSTNQAMAMDASGQYLIALGTGGAYSFQINSSTGALTESPGSPFAIGGGSGWTVTVTPDGKYTYAAGGASQNLYGFSISSANANLTAVPGSPYALGSSNYNVLVEPLGKFLYVGITSSGLTLGYSINSVNGALSILVGSPFALSAGTPGGLAFVSNPVVPTVYTSNGWSGYSATIGDLSSNNLNAGSEPALAVDNNGQFIYFTDGLGNLNVAPLDHSTGARLATAFTYFIGVTTAGIAVANVSP